MKFDLVIGNPPYTSDVYIPFVKLSHKLSSDKVCMITPANWVVKQNELNTEFKEYITPYIVKLVFYPISNDVFNICFPGGVCYYLLDRDKHSNREVKTISKCNSVNCGYQIRHGSIKTLYNSTVEKIMGKTTTLDTIDKTILKKASGSNSFLRDFYLPWSFRTTTYTPSDDTKIACYSGSNIIGYVNNRQLRTTKYLDKWKITQTVMLSSGVWSKIPNYGISKLNKLPPHGVPIGSYPIIAVFDTEAEANSFISYTECKLIKFLHFMGVNATTETSEFWRFIPDPGKLDHIFTNDEVYKKYNMTDEEIGIIESVIKDRKG